MKYFALSETMDLSVTGYPNKFPVLYLATTQDREEIKALFIEANLRGFSADIRSVSFGPSFGYHKNVGEVIQIFDTLPIVDEKEYWVYKSIPHWNPLEDVKSLLARYVDFHNAAEGSELKESLQEIAMKFNEEIQKEREVHESP